MTNRNEPMLVPEMDIDDNVSCVTAASKMTLETQETLTTRERELLHLPQLFVQLINNYDMTHLRQFFLTYFTEDCLWQTATMDAPVFGVEHIIATATGVMQNIPDFMVSATNIRLMNSEEIAGSTVPPRRCIVFDRNLIGKYCNQIK